MLSRDARDPRPRVEVRDGVALVSGVRCTACGYAVAFDRSWCPACRGDVAPATFGPGGEVWSATVVRIATPGRTPPYALAYVDLDDGPRVLAHVRDVEAPPSIGTRVLVDEPNSHGDLQVGLA